MIPNQEAPRTTSGSENSNNVLWQYLEKNVDKAQNHLIRYTLIHQLVSEL